MSNVYVLPSGKAGLESAPTHSGQADWFQPKTRKGTDAALLEALTECYRLTQTVAKLQRQLFEARQQGKASSDNCMMHDLG